MVGGGLLVFSVVSGAEVVILRVENGVAEVIPFDTPELPPTES